jgi:hypothetical protein
VAAAARQAIGRSNDMGGIPGSGWSA